jgi:hypothetical protein
MRDRGELHALVAHAVETVCPTFEQPFQENKVAMWVLHQPLVADCRGTDRYDDIARDLRKEIVDQLRTKTDKAGTRMYLAGRGKEGRYVWYPVRVLHDMANGDEGLLHKLLLALQRQDAEYLAV